MFFFYKYNSQLYIKRHSRVCLLKNNYFCRAIVNFWWLLVLGLLFVFFNTCIVFVCVLVQKNRNKLRMHIGQHSFEDHCTPRVNHLSRESTYIFGSGIDIKYINTDINEYTSIIQKKNSIRLYNARFSSFFGGWLV